MHAAQHRWRKRDGIAGNLLAFARLRDLLDPLHRALFAESNPIPLKAALAGLQLCADEVRLPLTRAVPATRERLAGVLARLMTAEDNAARARQVEAMPG